MTFTRPFDIAYQWSCALCIAKHGELDKPEIVRMQIASYKESFKPLMDLLVQKLDGVEYLEETVQDIIQRLKATN